MSEFKVYEPPELTIHADEYYELLGDYRKLMREHTELIEKYYQLNEEYAGYKKFVKPGGVSNEDT